MPIGNSLWETTSQSFANPVGKPGIASPFFNDIFIQSFPLIITRQLNSTWGRLCYFKHIFLCFALFNCAHQKSLIFLIFTTCTRLVQW